MAIRDTLRDDLSEIFRIQRDELVRPHQYKLRPEDSIEVWADRLQNGQVGDSTFKCSTIWYGSQIVGHVTHVHFGSEGSRVVQCGWNLDPRFWGRGIMTESLRKLFDRFFLEDGIQHVVADCFRENVRCKRVLDKLGFVPNGVPFHHRVLLAWHYRCLHWIERFRLDADRWSRK